MSERLLSIDCGRCQKPALLETGAELRRPEAQRWRCRWCGQMNCVTADARIVRAFKRADTPTGRIALCDRWQRGYLREPSSTIHRRASWQE